MGQVPSKTSWGPPKVHLGTSMRCLSGLEANGFTKGVIGQNSFIFDARLPR
jgi:hypothetical protein